MAVSEFEVLPANALASAHRALVGIYCRRLVSDGHGTDVQELKQFGLFDRHRQRKVLGVVELLPVPLQREGAECCA